MGTSHPETKPWVIDRIMRANVHRVLDVGAGAGEWVRHLRAAGFEGQVDAVEVWEPYVSRFHLWQRYDTVIEQDARTLDPTLFAGYGCVIFGDVLEHMTWQEATDLWRDAQGARHAAIAIPIVHYCQGELNGNPYETHVKDDWTHDQVLATFPGIAESQVFTVTGAYWR